VWAVFDDVAITQDENIIGHVEVGGEFVEDEDGHVFEDGARDSQTLALAAGEAQALLANLCVVAARQRHDKVVDVRLPGRLDHLFLADILAGNQEILADGGVEEVRILCDHAEQLAHFVLRQITHFVVTGQEVALIILPEAEQEVGDG
jgi:hypothetical protein